MADRELNYPAIMRAIAETGYKGFVAQEFLPMGEGMAALKDAWRICDVWVNSRPEAGEVGHREFMEGFGPDQFFDGFKSGESSGHVIGRDAAVGANHEVAAILKEKRWARVTMWWESAPPMGPRLP